MQKILQNPVKKAHLIIAAYFLVILPVAYYLAENF